MKVEFKAIYFGFLHHPAHRIRMLREDTLAHNNGSKFAEWYEFLLKHYVI